MFIYIFTGLANIEQVAVHKAYLQQQLTSQYQKATGSKGKSKVKEGLNLIKNWGKSLKETLTKFCKTAPKVAKKALQTGVSFGVGVVIQFSENTGIKPVLDKIFGEWSPKDWIAQNPGYSKGTPKTKEGQNILKNWGAALKNTLTKFCKTAKKAVKNKVQSGVAFGAGFVKQSLSNNGIVLPIDSRLAMWLDQDWIKKNPAYNKGIFVGQLAGLAQAASEYIAAGLTFTAGTLGSGVADLFATVGSGGAAAPAMPAAFAAQMALVTTATAAIGLHAGTVMQNSLKGNNYSSSGDNGSNSSKSKYDDWCGKNRKSDAEYHYGKHKDEVGAKDFNDYTRKANAFKDTVLKKGNIKTKKVPGKTPNVYRYRHNGKYIDLEHVMGTDLLGQPKILDYKLISYGTKN